MIASYLTSTANPMKAMTPPRVGLLCICVRYVSEAVSRRVASPCLPQGRAAG
jgi:hypothetical protein